MRTFSLSVIAVLLSAGGAIAQPAPPPAAQPPADAEAKKNANPCRDEVATALSKLRKSSWFRMNTTMITEVGPTAMVVDYVLPDRMYQKVTQTLTNKSTEVLLVGDKAWANQGQGWMALPNSTMNDLRTQIYENVLKEQEDVGNYACKGKVQVEGRDALSYKLEDEPVKDSNVPRNETYRMFYVDAVTGLPIGNSLLSPGREKTPLFRATYTFPLDMKIEPPKDVVHPPLEEPQKK
ncbi:MAG: hypothetical protein IKE66_05995 [Hyphomicrobium sp.]|nr:hypothetical protein [Hyphomicrobium sp.]